MSTSLQSYVLEHGAVWRLGRGRRHSGAICQADTWLCLVYEESTGESIKHGPYEQVLAWYRWTVGERLRKGVANDLSFVSFPPAIDNIVHLNDLLFGAIGIEEFLDQITFD